MTPLPRLIAFAACGVVGFFAASPAPAPQTSAPVAVAKPLVRAASALVHEWKEMRARHGGDAGSMAALYAELKDVKDAFRRRAFRSALIAEWAARDPLAALAFLEKNDDGKVGELFREWLRSDPRAAVARLLAGDEKSQERLREMLGDVARIAPSVLAEAVSGLPRGGYNFKAREAFEIFAKDNPIAARAAAESVSGVLRGQALAGVAKVLAEKDGPAAIAWAQSLAAGPARDDALRGALIGWAKSDPLAALDHIDIVPPNSGEHFRNGNMWISEADVSTHVLSEAARQDWDGTLHWMREHPGKIPNSYGLSDALSKRLNADLTGTLRSVAGSEIPGLRDALNNALQNWGYEQRDNIWLWLDQQPASDFTRSAREALIEGIDWKDPDTALEFLEKLPDSPENRQLLEDGTRSLTNGENAMNRFEDFLARASPKMRTYLIENALSRSGVVGTDAPLWVNRLHELPADRQEKAVAGLASSWARADPQAAIQWALAQPDPAQREAALKASAGAWASHDLRDAAAWINAQPAGLNRDIATRGLVGGLAYAQPESAWTWALSIQTPAQKIGALQSAYASLQKNDPALAEQFLQSANLPPADAKTVRQNPPK